MELLSKETPRWEQILFPGEGMQAPRKQILFCKIYLPLRRSPKSFQLPIRAVHQELFCCQFGHFLISQVLQKATSYRHNLDIITHICLQKNVNPHQNHFAEGSHLNPGLFCSTEIYVVTHYLNVLHYIFYIFLRGIINNFKQKELSQNYY